MRLRRGIVGAATGALMWVWAGEQSAAVVPRGAPDPGGVGDLMNRGALGWQETLRLAYLNGATVLIWFPDFRRPGEGIAMQTEMQRVAFEKLGASVMWVMGDAERDREAVDRFRVAQLPAAVVLRSDGRELDRWEAQGRAEFEAMMGRVVASLDEANTTPDQRARALWARAMDRSAPEDWIALAEAMGHERLRERVAVGIEASALGNAQRELLVAGLEDSRLAVRHGTIDVLEALTGTDLGFDPWTGKEGSARALRRWREWATGAGPTRPPALDEAELMRLASDLAEGSAERAERASERLVHAGPEALKILEAFEVRLEEMGAEAALGARERLREMRLRLLIARWLPAEARDLARRLVFGNLEARLSALKVLGSQGRETGDILAEYVADSDPQVREAAMEALVQASPQLAQETLSARLSVERDENVIQWMIRLLGRLQGPAIGKALMQFLPHANEEPTLAALDAAVRLKRAELNGGVIACLSDRRWRVRAAALKAVVGLELKSASEKVVELLNDPDEFVRACAAESVAGLRLKSAAPALTEAFDRHPEMRPVVVAGLLNLSIPVSDSMLDRVEASGPEAALAVIGAVSDQGNGSAPLLRKFAESNHDDVAAAALRALAASGVDDTASQELLKRQLESGRPARQLAILESLTLSDREQARRRTARTIGFAKGDGASGKPSGGGGALASLLAAFGAKETPMEGIERTAGRLLESPDELVRQAASLALLQLGEGDPEVVAAAFGRLRLEDQLRAAESVRLHRNESGRPLLEVCLRSDHADVRKKAVEALLSDGADASCLRVLLEEASRPGAKLEPSEVYNFALVSVLGKAGGNAVAAEMVPLFLRNARPDWVTFGLVIAETAWSETMRADVERLARADDPWHRRAAYMALANQGLAEARRWIEAIAQDSSPWVREVALFWLQPVHGSWPIHFDSEERAWSFATRARRASRPNAMELAALRRLSEDTSLPVRTSALLALLAWGETVDPELLQGALRARAGDRELVRQVETFLEENHRKLGAQFAFLLEFTDFGERSEGRQVIRHFKHVAERAGD